MMKKNIKIYLLLIIIPFFVLLPHTLQYLEMGNDFELYYFVYKKYIFEFLKLGHLPLWSPVEASGFSLIFNPLTQFFYFPSWIFYFLCFLFGDLTKYYFLLFSISAISIFNIGFFLFLRTLNIDYKVAITTIFITCLSLKINELLRFPNAIHAFAWFPWILYGINLSLIDLNSKKSFIIIFISCLMLLTAGYPYYIFYGSILFVFYFIFLLINKIKKNLFNERVLKLNSNKKFFLRCLFPSTLALLIASPWLLKISQLMSITNGRNLKDINFSLHGNSSIYDQIGSWIYPPFSSAEGWFYFGSISVMIIIVVFIHNIVFNRKNFNKNYPLKYFTFFLIFLIIFSYQISNPVDSLVFKILWNNLDFIKNFRFWERLNVIFVPIISVVLAYSIKEFISIINDNKDKKEKVYFAIIFSFILVLFIQFYFIFFNEYKNIFWETWQLKRIIFAEETLPQLLSQIVSLYKAFIYPIFFIINFLILISIIEFDYFSGVLKKNKNIFLILIISLTFSELFFLTNIQWAIPYGYYDNGFKKLNLKPKYNVRNDNAIFDLNLAFKKSSVSIEKSGNNNYEGNPYYRNNKKFSINHYNNWFNDNHVKLFQQFFNRNGLFKENLDLKKKNKIKHFFGMEQSAKRIFFSNSLEHSNINSYLKDSINHEMKSNFLFKLIYYDGNQLVLKVESLNNGWVSFIDTWDSNWQVFVNNDQKQLNQLFGAYKSVKIDRGESEIRFVYKPFNFNFKK